MSIEAGAQRIGSNFTEHRRSEPARNLFAPFRINSDKSSLRSCRKPDAVTMGLRPAAKVQDKRIIRMTGGEPLPEELSNFIYGIDRQIHIFHIASPHFNFRLPHSSRNQLRSTAFSRRSSPDVSEYSQNHTGLLRQLYIAAPD